MTQDVWADLMLGDCLSCMAELESGSVDAIVTDPPYGLSFMGKKWDYDVPSVEIWAECFRVLKHGGHLLSFAGTRTQHRMAVRIEDAGFEIRDMIAWVYGSGFPKSLDVSKAIDKAAGATPIDTGISSARHNSHSRGSAYSVGFQGGIPTITAPATDAARQWQGWGTALKPALEPITVARKPLIGTVAENVLAYGTGALNIDECRIPSGGDVCGTSKSHSTPQDGWDRPWRHDEAAAQRTFHAKQEGNRKAAEMGRWPANLIHDGGDAVTGLLGDAARFFYCPKASKKDRNEGCEAIVPKQYSYDGRETLIDSAYQRNSGNSSNSHPTVKPTDLMRYLCRLVTPPSGVILDPFMGSGSTGKAAMLEGFCFIGIERDAEYMDIAEARIRDAKQKIQRA